MARDVYGLDLGTYEIKVYDQKTDSIWKEKNTVAIIDDSRIFAVGEKAYRMYEKSPANISVQFPMKDGVISSFSNMQYLMQCLLKDRKNRIAGAEYVIAVPTDVTEVEKKAFFDLVIHSNARAREVNIIERGIAEAVGAGIPIEETKGSAVVNLGGSVTEVSVIAMGGLVLNRKIHIGGKTFDEAVVNFVRNNYDFQIGRLTAEELRKSTGLFGEEKQMKKRIAGKDLTTSFPGYLNVSPGLIRAAVRSPLERCVQEIRMLLERTPPDVWRSLQKNGICLTGGLANIPGIDVYFSELTGFCTTCIKEPEYSAVNGIKLMLHSKEYKKKIYSMLDERYRWMR